MAGEVRMGGLFYDLKMKSTLGSDIEVAKHELRGFSKFVDDGYGGMRQLTQREMDAMAKAAAKSTTDTSQSFRKMGFAMGEDLEKGATLTATLGTAMLGMGAAASAAGVDLGGFDKVLIVVGGSMTGLSLGVRIATSAVKAYTAFTTSTAIPTMYAYAAAVWAAHGPLIAVAGIAVGLTAAYVYLNRETENATNETSDLEKKASLLDLTLESLNYQMKALKRGVDQSNDSLEGQKKLVDDLNDTYDEYVKILDDLAGVPESLSDIDREIREAELDLAEMDLDPRDREGLRRIEEERKQIRREGVVDYISDLNTEKQNILTNQQTLTDRRLEIERTYHIGSAAEFKEYIKKMEGLRDNYYDDWIKKTEEFNKKQQDRENAQYGLNVANYQIELATRRKEGEFLTPEEKALWLQIPERAEALKAEPETFQKEDFWLHGLATLASIMPGATLSTPYHAEILNRIEQAPNPNYIQITNNVTVSDPSQVRTITEDSIGIALRENRTQRG